MSEDDYRYALRYGARVEAELQPRHPWDDVVQERRSHEPFGVYRRCWRRYNNGSRSNTIYLKDAEVAEWREFNEKMRFGCAQFIDGACVYRGYLSEERVRAMQAQYVGGPNA